jgi:hypothetical protein
MYLYKEGYATERLGHVDVDAILLERSMVSIS